MDEINQQDEYNWQSLAKWEKQQTQDTNCYLEIEDGTSLHIP